MEFWHVTLSLKTLTRNLDEDIRYECVPTKYARGPKWRGVVTIMEERIEIQTVSDHLKHCMEPKRLG